VFRCDKLYFSGINVAKYAAGDYVGFCISIEKDRLQFYKNGEFQGPAFSNIQGKELYPGITLFKAGEQVTIQSALHAPNLDLFDKIAVLDSNSH
jgi:hypothetical protein